MRHVLVPAKEDPAGKVAVEGGPVTVAEAVIDPVISQSLNRAVERG